MTHHKKKLLQAINEIRALSFQVSAHESLIANQKKRVASISQDMHELTALKTDYQAKSRQLTNTIEQVQAILHKPESL